MDHLQYFEPYDCPPHFENALTRAYLTLLRLSPLARASFLDSVRGGQASAELKPLVPPLSEATEALRFSTQVGSDLGCDSGYLASIVITGEPWDPAGSVEPSDRGYVYDGVVLWDDWILIIENKPWTNVWEEQLMPGLPEDTDIESIGKPINITWRELISRLNHLVESGSAAGPEALLIEDFRRYVDRNFPQLNPYGELGVCGSDLLLLQRRCHQLLGEIGRDHDLEIINRRGKQNPLALPAGGVREIFLGPHWEEGDSEATGIQLSLYPGDTMGQGKAFFRGLKLNEFLDLSSERWSVEANPHLAFMSTNLCWWNPPMDLRDYLEYWQGDAKRIRQLRRGTDDFAAELKDLEDDQVLSSDAYGCITQKLIETSRQTANLCPGTKIRYVWPLAQAVELDKSGDFGREVADRIKQAMTTWGQSLG